MTVANGFDPRRNGFDLLRLLFAVTVAVSHGIVRHTGWQPFVHEASLGDFGLDGFFILSGFLVVRSRLSVGSLRRFVWHRFLRIMPGFWVCLLVTAFVVAPVGAVLAGLPAAHAFTGEPSALRYLVVNAGLLIQQYDIAGIMNGNPDDNSFNGSLWTLAFEALCYALVALAGALGMLTRRRHWVLAGVAVLAVLTALQEAGVPVLLNDRILRLVFVFGLGALAWLYADRIPLRAWMAGAAAVLFGLSLLWFDDYRVLGAVPLAYLFVYAGVRLRPSWTPRADLSYGLYIYHWPVFNLLGLTVLAALPTWAFVPIGLAFTLVPAALSWTLVEKPALAAKHSAVPDRLARPFGTAFGAAPESFPEPRRGPAVEGRGSCTETPETAGRR